tara:strand:- start:32926 stop:35355 length:2430 start_codon:yes stop_codon:yes gene_type:complete
MLPLEKIFEKSLQFTVLNEFASCPDSTDVDLLVDNQSLQNMVAGDTFTLASGSIGTASPRVVTVLITDANESITNFTIIVKGIGSDDKAIEESFHFGNGLDQTGIKEFKAVHEVELDQISGTLDAGDVLDIGIGVYTDVWVQLTNKPIKYNSEVVRDYSAAATLRVRDTDYVIDYANGRLKAISGGDITAADTINVTYTIGQLWLDLDDLPDLIRVEHVIYPVGNIPQNHVVWDMWGRVLTITGAGEHDEQAPMDEDRHVAVYYNAAHQPPTIFSAGSYPTFLENTVLLASGAYALYIHAQKYGQQAVTDFASARTALGNISAVHTLITTALAQVGVHATSMGTALEAAVTQAEASATALAKINSDSGRTYLTDADTALNAYVTAIGDSTSALDKVDTYLAGGTESTKALLAQIATDIVSLRTASAIAVAAAHTNIGGIDFTDVATSLGKAITALEKVPTYLEDNSSEDNKSWLTKITTDIAGLRTALLSDLDAQNDYLDDVATDLTNADSTRDRYMGSTNYVDGGTKPDVKAYLDTGDSMLNTISVGGENERTPEVYALYARTTAEALLAPHERDRSFYTQDAAARTNAALAFVQGAAQRLSNLRSYIEQADGWGRIASGFVAEAVGRVQAAGIALSIERAKVDKINSYLAESSECMNRLRTYIEQAATYASISSGFITEARERTSLANSRISEANQRMAIADRYISESTNRIANANAYVAEASGRLSIVNAFIAESNNELAQIDRHIAEADRYTAAAVHNLTLASKFSEDATVRRDEAWTIWRDRKQYIGDFSSSAIRQMPSQSRYS